MILKMHALNAYAYIMNTYPNNVLLHSMQTINQDHTYTHANNETLGNHINEYLVTFIYIYNDIYIYIHGEGEVDRYNIVS